MNKKHVRPLLDELIAEDHEKFVLNQRSFSAIGGGIDFETRRLYIVGEIDQLMASKFIVNFHLLDSTPGPIHVVLSSGGGSVPDGFAIYDTIRLGRNQVIIEGYGHVASMASIIMQAGHQRLMAPNTRFMIHDGSVGFMESIHASTAIAVGQDLAATLDTMYQIFAKSTGLPLEEVIRLCKRETYLNATESVQLGFADAILTPEIMDQLYPPRIPCTHEAPKKVKKPVKKGKK